MFAYVHLYTSPLLISPHVAYCLPVTYFTDKKAPFLSFFFSKSDSAPTEQVRHINDSSSDSCFIAKVLNRG